MYRWIMLAHLFLLALLAGFMAVVQWSLVPAQNRLNAVAYATLEKGMNDVLEYLTPALMIGSLVTGVAVLYVAWRRQGLVWRLYALTTFSLVIMIVSTLTINAPVNSAIDAWNASAPPANWMELRDRWELGHAIRSCIGLIGLVSALAAAIWDADPAPS
jgi:anthrone oxygenase-like protein